MKIIIITNMEDILTRELLKDITALDDNLEPNIKRAIREWRSEVFNLLKDGQKALFEMTVLENSDPYILLIHNIGVESWVVILLCGDKKLSEYKFDLLAM